jgi:hypothetical protein
MSVVNQEHDPRDCSCLCELRKNTFELLTAYRHQAHIRSKVSRQSFQNRKLLRPRPEGRYILNRCAPGIQLPGPLSSGDQRYLVTCHGESNREDGTLHARAEDDNFQWSLA